MSSPTKPCNHGLFRQTYWSLLASGKTQSFYLFSNILFNAAHVNNNFSFFNKPRTKSKTPFSSLIKSHSEKLDFLSIFFSRKEPELFVLAKVSIKELVNIMNCISFKMKRNRCASSLR